MPSPYYVARRATALVGRLRCSHNAPSDGRAVWHAFMSFSLSLSPYHSHMSRQASHAAGAHAARSRTYPLTRNLT